MNLLHEVEPRSHTESPTKTATAQVEKSTWGPSEVSRYLGLGLSVTYALMRNDQLPCKTFRLGKKLLCSKAALMAAMESKASVDG